MVHIASAKLLYSPLHVCNHVWYSICVVSTPNPVTMTLYFQTSGNSRNQHHSKTHYQQPVKQNMHMHQGKIKHSLILLYSKQQI